MRTIAVHRPQSNPARSAPAPRLPHLIRAAIRLAWEAGPHELTMLAVCDALQTILVVAEILVARSFLAEVLRAARGSTTASAALPIGLVLTTLTVVVAGVSAGGAYYQRILAELASRHAKDRLLDVTQAVELIEFEDPDFYDRVARAQAGAQRVQSVVTSLSGLVRALSSTGGALVALVVLQPLLAPLVILVLAPALYAARRRSTIFYQYAFDQTPRDRERLYLERLLTDRDAAQEVRAFDLAVFLRRRHREIFDERIAGLRAVARRILRLTLIADLAAGALVALAMTVLLLATLGSNHSLATAGAAAASVLFLGRGTAAAGGSASGLSESALYLYDLLAFALPPGRGAAPPVGVPPRLPGPLVAEGVTFKYPGSVGPALEDVTMQIGPGEVVALVGANGSGKTTLSKILAGLYEPTGGRVLWNGEDIAGWKPDELAGSTAVIFQDFVRYAFSARDNIGLGRHERSADITAITAAASRAAAHDSITRLSRGYETPLGRIFDGAADLSVGQWQRIALARMVFRDAPFVILDEPTAALDAQAEHDLFSNMRGLLDGRAALLISHRFTSVRMADRIYVLQGGRLAEQGQHDDLVAAGGIYADLFAQQAAPYQ
jgi:ABC-type multidrug transport system fused ATPase/permease subunit